MKRIPLPVTLVLCAISCGMVQSCSNQMLYDGVRPYRQHRCQTEDGLSRTQQMECQESTDVSYEQYKQEQSK